MLVYETSRARSNRARDAQRCSRNSADRNSRFERESRGFESYRERCDLDHLEVHRCEYRICMKYFVALFTIMILVGCGSDASEDSQLVIHEQVNPEHPVSGWSYGSKDYDSCSSPRIRRVRHAEDGTSISVPELCNPYWRDRGDPIERQNPAEDIIRMPEVTVQGKLTTLGQMMEWQTCEF